MCGAPGWRQAGAFCSDFFVFDEQLFQGFFDVGYIEAGLPHSGVPLRIHPAGPSSSMLSSTRTTSMRDRGLFSPSASRESERSSSRGLHWQGVRLDILLLWSIPRKISPTKSSHLCADYSIIPLPLPASSYTLRLPIFSRRSNISEHGPTRIWRGSIQEKFACTISGLVLLQLV